MLTGRFFSDWLRKYRNRRLSRQRSLETTALKEALDRAAPIAFFLPLLVWGCCVLVLALQSDSSAPSQEDFRLDRRSPGTVVSDFDFSYPDIQRNREDAEKLRAGAPKCFVLREEDNIRMMKRLNGFARRLGRRETPGGNSAPPEGPEAAALSLSPDLRKIFTAALQGEPERAAFRSEAERVLSRGVMGDKYKSEYPGGTVVRIADQRGRERTPRTILSLPGVGDAARELVSFLFRGRLSGDMTAERRAELRRAGAEVMTGILGKEGNLVFDVQRSAEAADSAAAAQRPDHRKEVRRGAVLIRYGDMVDEDAFERMRTYNGLRGDAKMLAHGNRVLWRNIFISLVLVVFTGFYLYHIHPDVAGSNRRSALLCLMTIISVFAIYGSERLFFKVSENSGGVPPEMLSFFLPVALSSITLSVMLGYRVAICTGFFVVSVSALMLDTSFSFVLRNLALCALSALAVRNANNYRAFFLRAVAALFPLTLIANFPVWESFIVNDPAHLTRDLSLAAAWAAANGIGSAMAALFLIFVVEVAFNVTTNMALMVLCDYNHPLLDRLKREAPGTFFHSMMVSTLAEDAALLIGANSLKAKVAALFHDIGKLAKPEYFTENNIYMGNQHENLNPQLSAMIIREHVKEGMDLAKQYKLCRTIRNSIAQHHGDSLVKYFYRKALEEAGNDGKAVSEAAFRYDGEPPYEKEITIVSLADACEAACRALEKPTPARVEDKVNEIFRGRYEEGQLRNSALTLRELEQIKSSFIKTLLSMRHGRIEYGK